MRIIITVSIMFALSILFYTVFVRQRQPVTIIWANNSLWTASNESGESWRLAVGFASDGRVHWREQE